MKFPIVGGSYKNKYGVVNQQRTINYYIHRHQLKTASDKVPESLQPFPGLTSFADTTLNNIRKIFVARTVSYEKCLIVADNVLYNLAYDGTLTSIGTLTDIANDISSVYMAVNGNHQVLIVNGSASYVYTMGAETLVKVTDGDYPSNPTYLSYTQGYFFVTAGGRVYYSDLNDGTSWNALSVFTPTAVADKCLAAVVWRDDVHCFGSESIEIYINDGTTPFVKQDRSTINIGVASINSIVVHHDGIFFLGTANKGQKKVYFYNGQSVTPISTPDIDWALNNPNSVSGETWDQLDTYTWDNWLDAYGIDETMARGELQYTKDGHTLYYITIEPLRTTYIFDLTVQEWVERQSLFPSTTQQISFRGTSLVNFQGLNLWADRFTGKILKEDFTVSTEDSSQITRTRISQIFSEEKKNISIYSFEIDATVGNGLISDSTTAATVNLYYSRDGGNTYSSAISLNTGIGGVYNKRARVHKLGTGRDWVFKLVQTDNADIAINSAVIEGIIDKF